MGSNEQQSVGHTEADGRCIRTRNPKPSFAMSEDKGEYMGITLEWNGMLKSFPLWRNPYTVGSPPQLLAQDISGDGRPEAIILLNAGSGTGVYLEEPHVVDSRTFKEIRIQDPLEAARQRLVSTVERAGKDTVIRVTADGTVWERHLDKQESDGESPGGLTFGSIIKYEVRGGKLVAILAGAEGIENYLGEAVVTYTLQNGAYTAKSVSFSFTSNSSSSVKTICNLSAGWDVKG